MSRYNARDSAQALSVWVPRTRLGRLVQEGKITSISEIFSQGLKIQESEIVDTLLPNLMTEVLDINLVQKQTDAGERSRFKAIVATGNSDGYLGLGMGKAKQVKMAIEKATVDSKRNIFPVRRGCGSWECGCGQPHSLPIKVAGKCGSVTLEIMPGPRGLGLVAGEHSKTILKLAGIKDCWTKSFGATRTVSSLASATFNALKDTYRVVTPSDWVR